MPLRLVRCAHCRQRFNVSDAPVGTRLHCPFCAKLLTVPPCSTIRVSLVRNSHRKRLWIYAGAAAAAVLAFGVVMWIQPDRSGPRTPNFSAAEDAAPRPESGPAPELISSFHRPGVSSWTRGLPEARLKLTEDLKRSFEMRDAYPFLLAVESGFRHLKSDEIEEYARRLQSLARLFEREFAEPLGLPAVDRVLPVVILNSRQSYDKYCNERRYGVQPLIAGRYEYSKRRVVMYHDPYAPYEVVLHEGAHALVHHYSLAQSKSIEAYWFREGVGTYFEGYRRGSSGEIVLDPEANRSRLPDVQRALREGWSVPLERLTHLTIDDFWKWYEDAGSERATKDEQARLYYAQSWALVYFMLHAEEGRYRPAFYKYCTSELDGEGTRENFERALESTLGLTMDEFEASFIEFVRTFE